MTAKTKILIVEDESIVAFDLKRRLKHLGYQILSIAASGSEAIQKASELLPDIVLMNIHLKGDLDGIETAEQIHKRLNLPIIYLTAHSDEIPLPQDAQANPIGYLAKPFDEQQLNSTIQIALHQRQTEKKFSESQKWLSTTLNSIGDAVIATDAQGQITFLNPVAESLTGWAQQQALGQNLWKVFALVDEQTRTPIANPINDVLQSGSATALAEDSLMITRTSKKIPIAYNVSPIKNDAGKTSGVVLAFRDITKRKQIESETWEQRQQLESLVVERTAALTAANEKLRKEIAERERVEAQRRKHANEQTALYAIASAVASILDPTTLFTSVLEVSRSVLGCDAGWAVLPGDSQEDLPRIIAWQGVPESFVNAESSRPLHLCPAYDTFRNCKDISIQPLPIGVCKQLSSEILAEIDLHSHIAVPLCAGNKVLGFLFFAWREEPLNIESNQKLLISIGQQVGLALKNAQLYQAARQVDRLQFLNDLDQVLAATLNFEEVAETALRKLAMTLKASRGCLLIQSPKTHNWRILELNSSWQDWGNTKQELNYRQSLFQRFQGSQEPQWLPEDKLRQLLPQHKQLAEQWGPFGLIFPVWNTENLVSILTLGGRPEGQPFTEEERALVQVTAGRIGQAIQNAQLYYASQQRAARLAMLYKISADAGESLELDVVLHKILAQTCAALEATNGSILLKDSQTDGLSFALTLVEKDLEALKDQVLLPGQGIAGWVIEHGQAVRVDDVELDARYYKKISEITKLKEHALLCAPLLYHNSLIGVIEVLDKQVAKFRDEDLSFLESVGSIAAGAIENARLFANTRTRADDMSMLYKVGLALTATLDFATVVDTALAYIERMFLTKGVVLLWSDPYTGDLFLGQARIDGNLVDIPIRRIKPGEGLLGWVVEQRTAVLFDDAQRDPRFEGFGIETIRDQVHGLVAVPMILQDQLFGVLEIVSEHSNAYRAEELRTLQALGATLGVALENARLYEESKKLLSERENAQAQLVQSEKMAALGRLAASLAHEINNPLQALRSGFRLLLSANTTEIKRKQYLIVASREVERLISIVERVLGFYRPGSGQLEPIDITSILEETLLLAHKRLEHGRVAIKHQFTKNLPPVWASADQLKQVFLNLILNAQQAMSSGGTLTVITKAHDQEVHIIFSDTGIGLSEVHRAQLFQPFFTMRAGGTGLGLAISYGIVERHGGHIEVKSKLGLGSSFIVILPASSPYSAK